MRMTTPTTEIRLQVDIDPNFPDSVPQSVAFGKGFCSDESCVAYSEGELGTFYRHLIAGRPFPCRMVVKAVSGLSTLVAMALWMGRDLAIHPTTTSVVTAVDLATQWGLGGLAHVDRDLARLVIHWDSQVETLKKDDLKILISQIRDYILQGSLPALLPEPDPPQILDAGTNGFVLASVEAGQSLDLAWLELFRLGYLRGAVVSSPIQDRREVMVRKKSPYVDLDARKAVSVLNEAESAMGEPPDWEAGDTWMVSPPRGTLIPVSSITDVLIRV